MYAECSFCLGKLSACYDFTELNCGHQFHQSCLWKFLASGLTRARNVCPLCRAVVVEKTSRSSCYSWCVYGGKRTRLQSSAGYIFCERCGLSFHMHCLLLGQSELRCCLNCLAVV